MEQDRKVAVITGGSRGLGRNTVVSLARRGVDTIFTYKSARAEADAVAAEVAETGRRALPLQLDVGDAPTFDGFVVQVREGLAERQATHSTVEASVPRPFLSRSWQRSWAPGA